MVDRTKKLTMIWSTELGTLYPEGPLPVCVIPGASACLPQHRT